MGSWCPKWGPGVRNGVLVFETGSLVSEIGSRCPKRGRGVRNRVPVSETGSWCPKRGLLDLCMGEHLRRTHTHTHTPLTTFTADHP